MRKYSIIFFIFCSSFSICSMNMQPTKENEITHKKKQVFWYKLNTYIDSNECYFLCLKKTFDLQERELFEKLISSRYYDINRVYNAESILDYVIKASLIRLDDEKIYKIKHFYRYDGQLIGFVSSNMCYVKNIRNYGGKTKTELEKSLIKEGL